jgi:hypothetical protein
MTTTLISSPASWHRRMCWVHPRLVVTGDLPADRDDAVDLLSEWVAAGVTDIVDVRGEWTDAPLVAEFAPEIRYHWFGTDDRGTARSDAWFDRVLTSLDDMLDDPYSVIVVHCHMGVNRGPSMALRLLLEQGWDAIDALEAIREARPIAAAIYARDAVDHYHRQHRSSMSDRLLDARRVARWLADHPVDVRWIIDNIRGAGD